MKCPRDQSILEAFQKGNLQIHHCSQCGGFLIQLDQIAAKNLNTQLRKELKQPLPSHHGEGLESPHSQAIMKPFTYRGVHLDYCEQSRSVWFDQGEYTKIFANPQKAKSKATSSQKSTLTETIGSGLNRVGDAVDFTGEAIDLVGSFLGDFISDIDPF